MIYCRVVGICGKTIRYRALLSPLHVLRASHVLHIVGHYQRSILGQKQHKTITGCREQVEL